AVEEQFYLFWPLLVVLGLRGSRRRLLALSLTGALASLGLMLWLYHPGADPSRVYYGTDTRALELLVGAALACLRPPGHERPAPRAARRAALLLDLAGIALFGSLLAACRLVHQYDAWLYRGGMALLALATTGLIAIVAHSANCLVARLLALRPLRWLGRRSYAIYLWHWPILMVTRSGLDVPLSGLPLLGLQVAATLAIAELSFRLVEEPVRHGALGRIWRSLREDWRGRRRRRLALWAGTGMSASLALLTLGTLTTEARPPQPPAYLAVQAIHSVPAAPAAATPGAPSPPTATPAPRPTPLVLPTPERWTVAIATPTVVATPTPASTPAPTPLPTPTLTSTPAVATVPASLRVTALGDSVMVGAADALRQVIPNIGIDAVEGRQADELIAVARQLRDEGRLGDVVVVHLGSNGGVAPDQFDTLLRLLQGVPRVIVLNAKVPREWEAPNNAVIARGVARYPNAELLDWHRASSDHPEFFYDDGSHLRPDGAAFYAHLIASAIDGG
ncbi:MAG TPA: acyltransferase family protein, partial [Nitrolancea sp.]|nr:acyltransferase family protein [Nitrolancea sp.]